MAQGSQFPLRKPPGFHYDFFILGITTFIAGLLGIPAPNGLIPQAPIHTTSLLVMGTECDKQDEESVPCSRPRDGKGQTDRLHATRSRLSGIHLPHVELEPDPTHVKSHQDESYRHEKPVAVVEQRVSNLAQGSLCLVLLTGPFLHVLNLIPTGVLAGLLYVLLTTSSRSVNCYNADFMSWILFTAGIWERTLLRGMGLRGNSSIS